jgi:hypothetical protein
MPTLPLTVEFCTLMQLMEAEVLTELIDAPTSLIVHAARAAGGAEPTERAATELDARSSCSRLEPITPRAIASVRDSRAAALPPVRIANSNSKFQPASWMVLPFPRVGDSPIHRKSQLLAFSRRQLQNDFLPTFVKRNCAPFSFAVGHIRGKVPSAAI